ncbi:MAG: ATP-binding cassette domain-containing protein, partial [Acholeplasmataceae bacterium]|nr:ATP-binding cassette domain-containing protein [Acholeplasmataceae bacterium]
MKQDNKNSITLENQKPLGTVDYEHKVLEVKHLKKHFYVGRGKGKLTIPAVDDISFDVYKREVFGLVGESGCGKTTAARTIIRLYKPTEGTVDINGIRIGAGYLDLKNKIKKVKEDTKEKIISLNRYEYALLRMKKELASKSYILETDIEKLKKQRDAEIKQLENVINEVKDARYKLHNQLVLAVDNVKYNCKLKV